MQIFAEVEYFYKCLQIVITSNQDFWDTIAVVIDLNTLYNDFKTTTMSLLEIRDKLIDKIQSILQFKEAKNISKYTTRGTEKLAMTFRNNINSFKRKANNNEECFNYYKLRYFGRNCPCLDKRYQ